MYTRFWIFPLLFFPIQLGLSKRNYDINISKLDCRILQPNYISLLECEIIRKRIPVVSSRFILKEDIDKFNINATFYLIKKDNSRMSVAEFKMDGCRYLSSMYNNIMGRLFTRFKAVSNLPTSCPVPKGKLFEIRNYTFLADEFPPGVPQAKWQVRTKLLTSSGPVVELLIDGSVVYNT
ncbi:uncharacterized protein Dana_GF10357 [Drosophila ananassae]|uniref:MD-2-related lipid-recognition domain-containing protein n=1 Tax=Drosophila ananassae TaxID=7217 RepID=B3M9S0_DROAN|nr:uncharacterized protein LOC6493227 [Drosophila ananassae]EDV40111.2 uncharacterized protein Dana_GF10357 [Drosophila ananassae]